MRLRGRRQASWTRCGASRWTVWGWKSACSEIDTTSRGGPMCTTSWLGAERGTKGIGLDGVGEGGGGEGCWLYSIRFCGNIYSPYVSFHHDRPAMNLSRPAPSNRGVGWWGEYWLVGEIFGEREARVNSGGGRGRGGGSRCACHPAPRSCGAPSTWRTRCIHPIPHHPSTTVDADEWDGIRYSQRCAIIRRALFPSRSSRVGSRECC